MNTHRLTIAAAAALALSARDTAQAQSSTNVLDKTLIEAVPLEESVMPTVRPVNSVYGTDRSVIDTPRNVTIISREQLNAINIFDVRDFSKLTSSSYTRSISVPRPLRTSAARSPTPSSTACAPD